MTILYSIRTVRRAVRCLICLVALGLPSGAALAESAAPDRTRLYTIALPDRESVRYELDLPVEHEGRLKVHLEWEGNRVLAVKLEPPHGTFRTVRRNGVSPQSLETFVNEINLGTWTLSIHALAARGGGDGRIRVELPGPRPLAPDKSESEEPPGPPPEPWMMPRRVGADVQADWRDLVRATEFLRQAVTAEDRVVDSCHWQSDLLRYLATTRDRMLDDSALPEVETRKLLGRIAEAVRRVEAFRTSDDPVLVGPPPQQRKLRAAWDRLHLSRVRELVDELDEVLWSIERDYAPELASEPWPRRLVSCVMACQRHFEERSRMPVNRAINLDLARNQWDTLMLAADALGALAVARPDRDRFGNGRGEPTGADRIRLTP